MNLERLPSVMIEESRRCEAVEAQHGEVVDGLVAGVDGEAAEELGDGFGSVDSDCWVVETGRVFSCWTRGFGHVYCIVFFCAYNGYTTKVKYVSGMKIAKLVLCVSFFSFFNNVT